MPNEDSQPNPSNFLNSINEHIIFHRKWRNITMILYIFTTIGTITCTSMSTILALFEYKIPTAILAGIATILISTEKSLMFREKWKLHLRTYTNMENAKLSFESGSASAAIISEQIQKISRDYANELPISPRE